ncbi:T9SS type A sorting domain-containing protein [Flavobacterium sp. LaA7.5]|nr:T9SS type A sorting domain-containing protein [Flavobacterium salilacus subsp. altitudinum]
MKKLYTLSLLMIAGLSFGQTPIITGILDGDCSGGNPKALEIYANGTVDFANYSLENQTNDSSSWGNTLSLATFGTITNDFIYVVNGDANSSFSSEFEGIPSSNVLYTSTENDGTPKPLNINGNDRVRIIDGSMTVIDQYGLDGVNPEGDFPLTEENPGLAWWHIDSWARRADNTGPDGSAFNVDNWIFGGPTALEGLGECQGGNPFSTVVPFGEYNATASIKQNNISTLKIFPNPLSGSVLTITSDANAAKTVAIYDVLGKQVINTVTTTGTVNVSNLTSGIYIVKITEEGKTATRKLVVK